MEQLVQAIKAKPEDWELRLVFADWLEEHGQSDLGQLLRLAAKENHLGPTWPESKELKQLRRQVSWLLNPDEVGEALRRLPCWGEGRRMSRKDVGDALTGLLQVVPPWHPAWPGLARLEARYASWEPPFGNENRLISGWTGEYMVRPHKCAGWVVGFGGAGGQTWPGAWATWQDATLWGLAMRGMQRQFRGICLDLTKIA